MDSTGSTASIRAERVRASAAPAHTVPHLLELVHRGVRLLFVAALTATLVYFVVYTVHWPMLVNAPVMHYVNFLMRHGLRPYSEITDMNMPGAYLMERFGMSVFGWGDLGWRVYDFFLMAVLLGAATVIAAPRDWLAGVFAGGLFALRHVREGPWFSGEREEEMAVLLMASCALLFFSVRRERPALATGFGFLAGMAASIKPTLVPFAAGALLMLWLHLRQRRAGVAPYVLWSAAGLLAALLLSLGFLWRFHAFGSFLFVLRAVTPMYATLHNPGRRDVLVHALPREWVPLCALALVAVALRRDWNWERWVLLFGTVCGLASYVVQGKGFWYQRYIFLSFVLLLVALELLPKPAGRHARSLPLISTVALLWAGAHILPMYLRELRRQPGPSALTQAMEADLRRLGGDALQHRVQCFDMTFGCLNSLYHLSLVENTGFTGDLLLFPEKANAASERYRAMFWEAQRTTPAQVIVFTNQEFNRPNSFSRLARWPEFANYLQQNFQLVVERSFPYEDKYKGDAPAPPATAPTYRLYVRRAGVRAVANLVDRQERHSMAMRSGEER